MSPVVSRVSLSHSRRSIITNQNAHHSVIALAFLVIGFCAFSASAASELVKPLPDTSFTASGGVTAASNVKTTGWIGDISSNQWVQVDLGKILRVTSLYSQGYTECPACFPVRGIMVQHSKTSSNPDAQPGQWALATVSHQTQLAFDTTLTFDDSFLARYVRVYVNGTNQGPPALKFSMFGGTPTPTPTMTPSNTPTPTTTAQPTLTATPPPPPKLSCGSAVSVPWSCVSGNSAAESSILLTTHTNTSAQTLYAFFVQYPQSRGGGSYASKAFNLSRGAGTTLNCRSTVGMVNATTVGAEDPATLTLYVMAPPNQIAAHLRTVWTQSITQTQIVFTVQCCPPPGGPGVHDSCRATDCGVKHALCGKTLNTIVTNRNPNSLLIEEDEAKAALERTGNADALKEGRAVQVFSSSTTTSSSVSGDDSSVPFSTVCPEEMPQVVADAFRYGALKYN